jgi:hypothetical protein
MAFVDRLTSFDFYTRYALGQMIETHTLDDVCSKNPWYYMQAGDRLKVSSSVAALIIASGKWEIDRE